MLNVPVPNVAGKIMALHELCIIIEIILTRMQAIGTLMSSAYTSVVVVL
jgi:hypothetical protein